MTQAHINAIATAVPPHDVHNAFLRFGHDMLKGDNRRAALFQRMAERSGIEHRYSFLEPGHGEGSVDAGNFYRPGAFPGTAARMRLYEEFAPRLAAQAVEKLLDGQDRSRITHLIVTSCTGFSAPGVDLALVEQCGLPPDIERTMIGFMGCYAAINGLKLAHHIVRSEPSARVVAVNLELCTLHLHETDNLDEILSFLLFADGCAATLVTSEARGIAIESFRAALVPDTQSLIRWHVRDQGFDMMLSGQVPGAIRTALAGSRGDILGGDAAAEIDLWAVHPGGRSVLDAVEHAFALPQNALNDSRAVLRDHGNMSSGTVMFVLERMLHQDMPDARGCAMSFGPGLVAETMRFRKAA